jgi:hypothetical protein
VDYDLTVKFSNFKVPAEARSLEFEHLSPVGKNSNTLIADGESINNIYLLYCAFFINV